ncbi:hypothetical protein D3C77_720050 [compost metagenome]
MAVCERLRAKGVDAGIDQPRALLPLLFDRQQAASRVDTQTAVAAAFGDLNRQDSVARGHGREPIGVRLQIGIGV